MRIKHILWRVKNGWIRTPDSTPYLGSQNECNNVMVFHTLEQFCAYFRTEENDTSRTSTPKADDRVREAAREEPQQEGTANSTGIGRRHRRVKARVSPDVSTT